MAMDTSSRNRFAKPIGPYRNGCLDDADYDIRDEFKVKSKLCDKSITIRDKSGKVIGHEDVPVRIVAFWSADYDRRAKAQRVKAIDKASRMVANQASYEHAKKYGAARYVHEVFVDEKTGECQKSVISIDEEAIAKDERFDRVLLPYHERGAKDS